MFPTIDQELKIVLVGSSSVGKSSLLFRFIDSKFVESTLSTIGVDFKFRTLNVKGQRVKLQIWDTAGTASETVGQENFRAIVSAYYNGADGIVIVYDLSSWESFQDVKTFWMVEAKAQMQPSTTIMLLGAKSDLTDKREVIRETVDDFVKEQGIKLHFETSAKTNQGVEQAFTALAEAILAAKGGTTPAPRGQAITIGGPSVKPVGGAYSKSDSKCCGK